VNQQRAVVKADSLELAELVKAIGEPVERVTQTLSLSNTLSLRHVKPRSLRMGTVQYTHPSLVGVVVELEWRTDEAGQQIVRKILVTRIDGACDTLVDIH